MIKSRIAIKGKVTLMLRKSFRGMDELERLSLEEIETGKLLLTPFQKSLLNKAVVKDVTVNNLTMERGIDRMVCLFGRCPGYLLNVVGDDRTKIANMINDSVTYGIGSGPSTQPPINLAFPELIQLGSGGTTPKVTDSALEKGFPDSFRNTYNSKEGGSTSRTWDFDYENDSIAKYIQIYGSGEINSLPQPIKEVGLFTPQMHLGYFRLRADETIPFNSVGLNRNTLWTLLNLGVVYENPGLRGELITSMMDRRVVYNRDATGEQTIDMTQVPSFDLVAANVSNRGILAFTPRYDSLASAAPERGSINGFGEGQMLSRVVLPVSFIKNINFSLTVIWQIYFERLN